MKFWLLTTEFPPDSGGGISTYCEHTARMLAGKGHRVTIFYPHETNREEEYEEGIRVVRFKPEVSRHAYLGEETSLSLDYSLLLEQYAREHGPPDYIEAQEYSGIAYFALQRHLLEQDYFENTVFYITAHAPAFLYYEYNRAPNYQIPLYWVGEMEKSCLLTAHGVISPSKFLINRLNDYVDWSDQLKAVVHNPYAFSENVVNQAGNEIVFFGKLTPQKGGLELLAYFKILWDKGMEHQLRIIGSGRHFYYPAMKDMRQVLESKYRRYIDEGKLIFEGHIEPEELSTRLARAGIVIIPSTVDNLPYTVIESMAREKIVLASDQGGQIELIDHGIHGFLFNHDPEGISFIDTLRHILSLNEEEKSIIGRNARKKIREVCNYDTVYDQKMGFLQKLSPGNPAAFPFVRKNGIPVRKMSLEETNQTLTVVVPFYNMGEYLEECLGSIRDSTYPGIEILVINDGSDDPASLETLARVEKDPSVRVIHQNNGGLSRARNVGAENARGHYLAFLDADDRVDPTYYEKGIRVLRKYDNVSFVGCWASYFDQSKICWPSFNPEPPYLLIHNMINSSGLLYRKEHFLIAGRNDPDFIFGMEDYDSVINMVKNGYRGVALPETLWFYRIRKGSMARTFTDFSRIYLYKLLTRKHPEFFAQYAPEVINLLNANGPGFAIENPTRITRKQVPFLSPGMIRLIKRNKVLRNIAQKIYVRLQRK